MSPLILLLTIVFPVNYAAAQRSSYGEPCNATIRCERRSWLGCHDGICGCIQTDDMIYNNDTRKCAAKAGERCRYAVDLEPSPARYEVTDCITNSLCGPDGFCTCQEDFYEISNGTCLEAKKHGESCDEREKCSSATGLECKNGTCQCDQESAMYSQVLKKCLGLAGKNCVNNLCTDGARCTGSTCVCASGFYKNFDSTCLRKRGIFESCSEDSQCENQPDLDLRCINGSCVCDPEVSVYGTRIRQAQGRYGGRSAQEAVTGCLGKISKSCVNGLCVSGALCDSSSNKCYCDGGLSPKKSLISCGRSWDSHCGGGSDNECIDNLVCRNRRCLCPYGLGYSRNDRACYALIGGPCDESTGCVANAICRKATFKSDNHCVCKPGFIENANGICDIAFGEQCNETITCDTLANLQCINGTCQCFGFEKFDQKVGHCVALIGGLCNENLPCIENAHCHKERRGARAKCACNDGFVETTNYLCERFETDLPVLPKF